MQTAHPELDQAARRAGLAWTAFLPLGVLGWWMVILGIDGAVWWFVPRELGWLGVMAFAIPDTVLVATPCLIAASLLWRGERQRAQPLLWLICGAQGYSTLWSLVATLIAWESFAGPALMLPVWGLCANAAWTNQRPEDWFREAPNNRSASRNVMHTLFHGLVFDVVCLVLLPVLVLLAEQELDIPPLHHADLFWPLLAIIVVLNLAVGMGSGVVMAIRGNGTPLPVETASTLVTTGPYAYLRNPMASVGILQGVLLGVALASTGVVAYALLGAVVWHGFVRPIEEADLEHRFGDAFRQYRDSVPLWIPRFW